MLSFIKCANKKIYVCLYVYIYIYCHPQPDCFVGLQLISVARHAGRFKPGSKPTQLYVGLNILPNSHQAIYISLGIMTHYVLAFVCLHFVLPDTGVLYSFVELCIRKVAAVNSFARELNPRKGSVYIVIYRPTVSLYHNSSVWRDT